MTKSTKAMPQAAATSAPPTTQPSKKDQMLALLRAEGGASLGEMASATSWLPHTTRAMLTGLRKKGHVLDKAKVDGVTRYSIRCPLAS